MKNEKSFTLIELLVVIAIIGLLSSIVLVNMDLPKQRQKARIAKTLEFSQSIQNALGSEAVGIWSFDNCTANDSSGYGNNGTINGASCVDDTPQKVIGQGQGKYALSFDGTDDYVNVPHNTILQPTTPMTVEAWVKVTTNEERYMVNKGSLWQYGNSWYFYEHASGQLGFIRNYGDGSNAQAKSVTSGAGNLIGDGQWHHIVGTDDGTNLKVYIDGVQKGTPVDVTGLTPYTNESNPLTMFRMGTRNYWYNGTIDEVRIYNQALTIGQIQKHYVKGLEKFKLVKD